MVLISGVVVVRSGDSDGRGRGDHDKEGQIEGGSAVALEYAEQALSQPSQSLLLLFPNTFPTSPGILCWLHTSFSDRGPKTGSYFPHQFRACKLFHSREIVGK